MKKLIGTSAVMERLREDILDLGQADSHVLIDGETGTGKTLVAHALHAVGPRASKKFVTISAPPGPRISWPPASSAPSRKAAFRWSRRPAAARCALRISRRCPARCRRGC
jgi:hypothetical protein